MPNPWEVLAKANASPVPVVLDQTTATYGLNPPLGRGDELTVHGADDRKVRLQVAGLLNDSIFQGELLLNEESLRRYAPDAAGYRYFLVEAPPGRATLVQQALQQKLGDYGFASETTIERLSALAAIQNTYLATFQSLGGLGLLLGTIGLAVVQWRNVLERRGELALAPCRRIPDNAGRDGCPGKCLAAGIGPGRGASGCPDGRLAAPHRPRRRRTPWSVGLDLRLGGCRRNGGQPGRYARRAADAHSLRSPRRAVGYQPISAMSRA